MARFARVVLPDCPYHLTHRGNRKERIFFNVADRRRYLDRFREYGDRYQLELWAYCLMTNHVHLIVLPKRSDSLARTIGNAHRHHARWIHARYGWTGHLWANRFYSTPLDEAHLWLAVRYVELNPVRAGIALDPTRYRWSSAAAHAVGREDGWLAAGRPFPGSIEDWRLWLMQDLAPADLERIRKNTSTGRPTGSDGFVRRFEQELSRSLRPRRRVRSREPEHEMPTTRN